MSKKDDFIRGIKDLKVDMNFEESLVSLIDKFDAESAADIVLDLSKHEATSLGTCIDHLVEDYYMFSMRIVEYLEYIYQTRKSKLSDNTLNMIHVYLEYKTSLVKHTFNIMYKLRHLIQKREI